MGRSLPAEPKLHAADHLTRRRFLLGAGAAASAVALYSGEIARHELEIVDRTIRIRNLPEAFHGYRIVQISDIHLETFTEEFFLDRVIDRVNATPCDLVLITGDFVTKTALPNAHAIRNAGRCGEMLRRIACPARYSILGNHDDEVGGPAVADQLRTNGLPVLINQRVPIERGSQHLWLYGVGEVAADKYAFPALIPEKPDAPMIVMAHEPDFADDLLRNSAARKVDLVLAGHSHGGQIRLPGLRPLLLPPGAKRYYEGHYQFGELQMYVNRGIGSIGVPFRLFCPPEITVFTLQPNLPA